MSEKAKKKAGRPRKTKAGGMPVMIYIPKEQREPLRRLGGSRWISEQIKKAEGAGAPDRDKQRGLNA